MSPLVSIVIPVFNSASSLETVYTRTSNVLQSMGVTYEFIFVDDGSQDTSWSKITELQFRYGALVRGIKLDRNYGQQIATLCGLQQAKGKWISTMDDDLQTAPEELPKLFQKAEQEEADVVYANYNQLKHNLVHKIGSSIYQKIYKRLVINYSTISSYRLIRASIIDTFFETGQYIDPMLAKLTTSIYTVEVNHNNSVLGKSRYSSLKLIKLAIVALLLHSRISIKLIYTIGVLLIICSMLIGVLQVGYWLDFNTFNKTLIFTGSYIFIAGMLLILFVKIVRSIRYRHRRKRIVNYVIKSMV